MTAIERTESLEQLQAKTLTEVGKNLRLRIDSLTCEFREVERERDALNTRLTAIALAREELTSIQSLLPRTALEAGR